MRAHFRAVDDVERVSDGCDENFCIKLRVIVVDTHDIGDKL